MKKMYGYAYKFRIGRDWYGNWVKFNFDPHDDINEGYEKELERNMRQLLFTHAGMLLERIVKPSDIVTIQDFQTFRGLVDDIEQFLKPEVPFIDEE